MRKRITCSRCYGRIRMPIERDPRTVWHECVPPRGRSSIRKVIPAVAVSSEEILTEERKAWAQEMLGHELVGAFEAAVPAEDRLRRVDGVSHREAALTFIEDTTPWRDMDPDERLDWCRRVAVVLDNSTDETFGVWNMAALAPTLGVSPATLGRRLTWSQDAIEEDARLRSPE